MRETCCRADAVAIFRPARKDRGRGSMEAGERRIEKAYAEERLWLGGNSAIPAIVNGVSKLRGLAKAALAEGAGTAPIVRAVSCYETRRASERDRDSSSGGTRRERSRERRRERAERASQAAVKQADPGCSFLLVLFLLLLSVRPVVLVFSFFCCFPSHGSCHAGDRAESKPPMCLARPPAVGLLPRGLWPLFSSLQPPRSLSSLCPASTGLFPLPRGRLQRGSFSAWARIDRRSSRAPEFSYAVPSRRNR